MSKENKNFNKIMATAITASVATSAIVVLAPSADAAAANFKDVQSNEYFYEAVNSLHMRDIIKGYDDGTFRPYERLTRAQAAKIIALALDLDTSNIKDPGFKDVPKGDFAYKYICSLADKGIIAGYGDEFKPNDPLTRAQMAKIISLAYNFQNNDSNQLPFTDVKQGDWSADYIGALFKNEITTGTTPTTFSPNKHVTRGQIASFVYRSEKKAAPVQITETVSNITNETLVTSEGIYTLSNEQKKWINPSNLAALKGAVIELAAKENEIEKIERIELTAKGSISTDLSNPYANHVVFDGKGATVDANITVNGDYFTLKNMTINGDLHVGKGVESSFFSEFTKVEGKTTIDDSLQSVNQTSPAYKTLGFKLAAANSFLAAANETAARGRVVFSEFQLGNVDIDKNADVIFLSKTTGTSLVGEIVVNSNATLTSDQSVTLPKVSISQGAKEVAIYSNVTSLQVTATGEIKLSGKGDIANLSVKTNANVAIQTQGKVGTLETVNKETKITLGTATKVGNLVVPSGSKPSDIIGNYDSVKENVEQVGGTKNPDTTPAPPSGNNGGGSSDSGTVTPSAPAAPQGLQGVAPSILLNDGKITGLDRNKSYQYKLAAATTWNNVPASSNEITGLAAGSYEVRIAAAGSVPASQATAVSVSAYQAQTEAPTQIAVINYYTAGHDEVLVNNVPAGVTVKVYDASSNGNLIGSFTATNTGIATVQITNGFNGNLNKVYVTLTESGKAESSRAEKGVPTSFPDAPTLNDIVVKNTLSGSDTVTVKLPTPASDYSISLYDITGRPLSGYSVIWGSNGEKYAQFDGGFLDGLTEIDVAIVKISDQKTQCAESLRTRVSIPPANIVDENVIPLNIQVDNTGVISGDTASNGATFKYLLVSESKGAEISSWNTNTTESDVANALGGILLSSKPTLTAENNDKRLVAIGFKDGKVVSAGESAPINIEGLGNLTVSATDDDNSDNKTSISVNERPDAGNEYVYKIFNDINEANSGKPVLNADVNENDGWTNLPNDGLVEAANGKIVVIVERNATDKKAKKVGQATAVTEPEIQLIETVMLDGKSGVSPQDGNVETIRLKFSSNIDPASVRADSFKVIDNNSIERNIESIKVTDKNGRTRLDALFTQGEEQYITIKVSPVTGTSPNLRVIQQGSIRGQNGAEITGINVQAIDRAAPVIIESTFHDEDANGIDAEDLIKITFSENIQSIDVLDQGLVNDFMLKNTSEFDFDGNDTISFTGNVVTVKLGSETASKLSHGTTITMSSNGDNISIVDLGGNKAKQQQQLVPGEQYSQPKDIEIQNIQTP
ncbi:S-layer homology domain-containing protein [Cytobacillus massiliigabonensis]|uniref:S-layer homology domain-containing protein n=1 Tax=Cytobacillus massiliigabonensis TaxID=1871011 RepID=UPI000C856495|nr:S-layer homology domain-containing protein [Cytobacillus massiliigabonensis]